MSYRTCECSHCKTCLRRKITNRYREHQKELALRFNYKGDKYHLRVKEYANILEPQAEATQRESVPGLSSETSQSRLSRFLSLRQARRSQEIHDKIESRIKSLQENRELGASL